MGLSEPKAATGRWPPDFFFKFKVLGSKKTWGELSGRMTPLNRLAHGLTCIFKNATSEDTIIDSLTNKSVNINKWLNANKITVNHTKNKYIFFSYRKHLT